jgi:hypothetical protein
MNKSIAEGTGKEKRSTNVNQFSTIPSDTSTLTQKLEEIENIQAEEKDKLVLTNKNLDNRFNDLESMMKTLLSQVGNGQGKKEPVKQYDPNMGIRLGAPGTIPRWGPSSSRVVDSNKCFYCGGKDHYIPDCKELKDDMKEGMVKTNAEGKLRLNDGSFIPNIPNGAPIKERIEKHYAQKQNQFYCGNEEDENSSQFMNTKYAFSSINNMEDPIKRRARLQYELDLKEKEEALEIRQLKLERDEKKKEQKNEQMNKNIRTAHVLDLLDQLTEDELSSVKATKAGF